MNASTPSPDAAVLDAARAAIRRVQSLGVLYADVFSPLHEDGLRDALRRLTIWVRVGSIGSEIVEVVGPPIGGRYLMLVSSDIDDRRRGFAMRHGMGHVAASHVSEHVYLRNRDEYATHEERVADLFAIADLFPWVAVESLRSEKASWRSIEQEVLHELRRSTIGWPHQRVQDRASLRMALYRAHQL